MKNEYSTLNIVRALDIPRERLREWMNRGFIKPTRAAEGQGTKAVFTRTDVYCVSIFRELVEKGHSRKAAAGFIGIMPSMLGDKLPRYLIFKFGDFGATAAIGVTRINNDQHLLDYFRKREYQQTPTGNWSQIQILNFEALRGKIDNKLATLE